MISKLPTPLRDLLEDGSDEATRQQLWRAIRARREAAPARGRLPRFAGPALAVAAVAAVVVLGPTVVRSLRPRPAGPAPLAIAGGTPVGALLQARADAPLALALTDGSRVVLAPGARLELGENGGATVSWVLRDGDVRFSVHKGRGRRWLVHAGLATVEVTGTQFTVSRRAGSVTVTVHEGSVRVTSDRLEPAVQVLRAGHALTVAGADALSVAPAPAPAPHPSAAAAAPASPAAASAPATPAAPRAGGRGAPVPERPSPLAQALAEPSPERAYALLGADGVARQSRASSDPATLLALADVARRSGHPAEALAPLSRVVREFPGDPRAGLAAFTLGRVQLGSLGDAGGAAASFERALALGLPATLRGTALARLVEASARAGDRAGAARWAAEYRRAYPSGPWAAQVERWATP